LRMTWHLCRTPGMHRGSVLAGQERAMALGPASWDLWSSLFARTGSKRVLFSPFCAGYLICRQGLSIPRALDWTQSGRQAMYPNERAGRCRLPLGAVLGRASSPSASNRRRSRKQPGGAGSSTVSRSPRIPRPGVPVFTGQGSARTRAGVWRAVTGLMAVVGLDPHDATHLYRTRGADLEIVQEQLGHASIKITTIYAKVTKEDKARAAEALAKVYRSSHQNGNSVTGSPRRFPGNAGEGARTVATF
jgi:hypothetical protein